MEDIADFGSLLDKVEELTGDIFHKHEQNEFLATVIAEKQQLCQQAKEQHEEKVRAISRTSRRQRARRGGRGLLGSSISVGCEQPLPVPEEKGPEEEEDEEEMDAAVPDADAGGGMQAMQRQRRSIQSTAKPGSGNGGGSGSLGPQHWREVERALGRDGARLLVGLAAAGGGGGRAGGGPDDGAGGGGPGGGQGVQSQQLAGIQGTLEERLALIRRLNRQMEDAMQQAQRQMEMGGPGAGANAAVLLEAEAACIQREAVGVLDL